MARVQAHDGAQWRIGRRWLPWRPRKRDVDAGATFSLLDAAEDPLSALALFVLAVVVAASLGFLLPFLLLGAEFAVIFVLIPLLTAWRVLARRPFTVVASRVGAGRGAAPAAVEQIVGWRASGRLIEQWCSQVRSGGLPGDPMQVLRGPDLPLR